MRRKRLRLTLPDRVFVNKLFSINFQHTDQEQLSFFEKQSDSIACGRHLQCQSVEPYSSDQYETTKYRANNK